MATSTNVEMCDCRNGSVTDEVHFVACDGNRVSRACASCAGWLMSLGLRAAQRIVLR